MTDNKKSDPSATENIPADKSITISGDVVDSVVIVGNKNTVNQTIIQKFFNIFKSDSETFEQRNRRLLLAHVENAWIKGMLDASLHGAALLDLGIKQDPEAVIKYPWAIKKESTDETIPAGTSMLEIFDSIGMGRSLLILGAPGSGKTTMLLELARQSIERAREDVTYPIPMVFNLASWTEKLSLADWLAQELNNLYSVPRKTAPDWVKGDKLLLLLDSLDEVRQESRVKCVEAINAFRKEHGLTSLAVCSRSQDYVDLNAKLSFEGAIEIQPLTQIQITEFFNRFGKEIAGIKNVLKKDTTLREMAETPLFLSIMIMAYRDKQDVDILKSKYRDIQRKHLFDTYIERMFERPRSKKISFKNQEVLHWLAWLAGRMVKHNQSPYFLENMQPEWLGEAKQIQQCESLFRMISELLFALLSGLLFGLVGWLIFEWIGGLVFGLISGLVIFLIGKSNSIDSEEKISTVDSLFWNWRNAGYGLIIGLIIGLIVGLFIGLIGRLFGVLSNGLIAGLYIGLFLGVFVGALSGLSTKQVDQITYPEQRLIFTAKNFLSTLLGIWLIVWLILGLMFGLIFGLISGLFLGLFFGLQYGGITLIRYYTLHFILTRNNLLPWRLVPFLNYCVDLIFLRRVGGGYIFVHRLLMEHFAEMYVETPTSKGN